jgi:hypothetical protein
MSASITLLYGPRSMDRDLWTEAGQFARSRWRAPSIGNRCQGELVNVGVAKASSPSG